MSGIAFNESLILEFDKPMTDREVLSAMTDYLCEKGIVKDTYKQAILEREQSFPTGLKTGGINVAIPHADICHVNEAAICVAVLKTPAPFRAMDEPDNDVPVSLVIMLALTTFVSKSKMGKAMRACSEDKGAAQLMGIDVNTTISVTFAIGSALAAIAGVLLCSFNTSLMPTTGSMPGIKAFTAAVFGGIGSIPGAFLGGLLLGIIEALAKAYISTQLANSIVFAVLIVVLLVKPAGLLGKIMPEKV